MEKNKTGKYLKYAIGEIVLVVIGILIALQINNWNNDRLTNEQMNSFLLGMSEDLKIDTLELGKRIKLFDELVSKKKKILSSSELDNFDKDQLYIAIRPLVNSYEFNATTFNKVTNSGITKISENDDLSSNIYDYYTTKANDLNGLMDWDNESSSKALNYWHFGQNIFELNLNSYNIEGSKEILNFQDESTSKLNLVKLISEPKGRNYLKRAYARKHIISNSLRQHKDWATKLISEIEIELNK